MVGIFEHYAYHDEAAYYAQYAGSFFAVTRAKAGFDSLRHYEILARGTMPFFLRDSRALARSSSVCFLGHFLFSFSFR